MCARKINAEDVTGKVYGRLTVINCLPRRKGEQLICECKCSCGKQKRILHAYLRAGTKSCGCLTADKLRAMRLIHGATTSAASPGLVRSHAAWVSMRNRCYCETSTPYPYYGGRGITICTEWDDFNKFYLDMGDCPEGGSLEREEVNNNYEASNCCWRPNLEQSFNRRDTIRIWYKNQEWCLKELCRHLNKPYLKIYKRYVMRGWDLVSSLNMPEHLVLDLKRIYLKETDDTTICDK